MLIVNFLACFVGLISLQAENASADDRDRLKAVYDFEDYRVLEYKVANTLKCNITDSTDKNFSIRWLRNNQILEGDKKKYDISNNQLVIHRTTEEDLVAYTCILATLQNPSQFQDRKDFKTLGMPTAKIVSQGTFIEGQKITLECVVSGKPIPTIQWVFGNQTFNQSTGRVQLLEHPEKKIPNAILQINEAEMSDRGEYICRVANMASNFFNKTIQQKVYIRVKDNLAALWPFIGICAEVLVLCAIIFVYERKRNKSELDESDTDISPDQKNTPDHGKDSVRQRK